MVHLSSAATAGGQCPVSSTCPSLPWMRAFPASGGMSPEGRWDAEVQDVSDPGTIHFITHTGQSWVLSAQFLRGSPVGPSTITHDGDLPINGSLVAVLPSQAHFPPGLPGLTFQKDCMHSRLGLRPCFRRNPDYDTSFFPGRIQGVHEVYVTYNML